MPKKSQTPTDSRQRRRLQNRIAQRKHRQKLRAKREAQRQVQDMNVFESVEIPSCEPRLENRLCEQSPEAYENTSDDSMSTSKYGSPETDVDFGSFSIEPLVVAPEGLYNFQCPSSFVSQSTCSDESTPQGSLHVADNIESLLNLGMKPYFLDSVPDITFTEGIGHPMAFAMNEKTEAISSDIDAAQAHLNLDSVPICQHQQRPYGFGKTVLQISAENGHEGIVRTLLKFGANPDISDSMGNVALHYAARNGHIGVVAALLSAGANPALVNLDGFTAMHLAGEKGFENIVILLIGASSSVHSRGGFKFV